MLVTCLWNRDIWTLTEMVFRTCFVLTFFYRVSCAFEYCEGQQERNFWRDGQSTRVNGTLACMLYVRRSS